MSEIDMELTINDIEKIWFEDEHIYLRVKDGREQGMPIRWFPRLQNASKTAKNNFEMRTWGIHWPTLDEDLSYGRFFTYNKDEVEKGRTEVQLLLSRFPAIKINELAVIAGISPVLMRHYACGVKTPSAKRLAQIKEALHKLGRELIAV